MSRKLSIYAVEHPVISWFSGKIDFYHAYLALVDETRGPIGAEEFFTPEQELHFMDTEDDSILTARVYAKERHPNAETYLMGYVGGDEISIRKIWNRALAVGVATRRAGLDFNKSAQEEGTFNCRSGVEAALKAMGICTDYGEHPVLIGANPDPGALRTFHNGRGKNLLGYLGRHLPPLQESGTAESVETDSHRLLERLAP